jgi:GT2 family glycosyltransferase
MAHRHTIDWNVASPDPEPDRPPGTSGNVDVIVPVYGAAAELAPCLASLRLHTNLAHHRLLLVIDGPQGADVEAVLASFPPGHATLLRNPERRGFVASVNRGMGESAPAGPAGNDVTLLNSDTVVTTGWLEKLQAAAYSHPAIATVTPFSNHATIASLPRFAEVNALPAGWSADRFAALVERVSVRERPALPTGVGVCLYIKRKALDRLGLFDAARFGLGYGEESEFCFRALKAGYLNVLDDATFIYHAGQKSFGASRPERVKAAHRALSKLHPEYLPTVARFLREDPLRPARERVVAGLKEAALGGRPSRPRPPRRILHLVHGWPPWSSAGTEVYARRLALRQAAWREVTVYARMADPGRVLGEALELADGGARVRLAVNNFVQRDPLSRNALYDRRLAADFAALLDEVRPELLHVHHLAGHAATLPGVAARRRIPILYQIQDWWSPCARANLLDAGRRLCPGPAPGRCSACLPMTALPGAPLLNRLLYAGRERLTRRALATADAFVMGSHAILASYRRLGWLPDGRPALVIPYGIERPAVGLPERPPRPRAPGEPLRCGVIGSILPHKGIHLAVAAFRGVDPARATLAVWGDTTISPPYTAELQALASPAVRFAGRFPEERRGEVFAGLDVLIVPSLGLESFGLVAHEALAEGVPVLASRRGALAELFAGEETPGAAPRGALFDPDAPDELAGWIARLAARPEIAAEWAAAVLGGPDKIKEMDEHALEIESVYAQILSARGSALKSET